MWWTRLLIPERKGVCFGLPRKDPVAECTQMPQIVTGTRRELGCSEYAAGVAAQELQRILGARIGSDKLPPDAAGSNLVIVQPHLVGMIRKLQVGFVLFLKLRQLVFRVARTPPAVLL